MKARKHQSPGDRFKFTHKTINLIVQNNHAKW